METITPNLFKRIFLNPLVVRELRVACRSWKLVAILTSYLLIQATIFCIWLFAASEQGGTYSNPTSVGFGLFVVLSVVLVGVVMLVFPAFSATAIASEHERKSFDLLLLTPLAPWEIASGKFFAAAIQASVFLIATVPLFTVANIFGGIDPAIFFVTLWALVLLSVFISFLGVYASSLVKKALPAVMVTYLFALMFGAVMLVLFLVSLFSFTRAFPIVAFMTDPSTSEAIYMIVALTTTCAIYCVLLFLNTTNRLKPTSHNKSTSLRIFWTLALVAVPMQIAGYFWFGRIMTPDATLKALMLGIIYVGLLLATPAFTAPSEPPIASRRVRREMEKVPQGFLSMGGSIFFPGSARGVAHLGLLAVIVSVLMLLATTVCFGALKDRLNDREHLMQDYATEVQGVSVGFLGGVTMPSGPTAALPKSEQAARDQIAAVYDGRFNGYVLFLATMIITILVIGQITWRMGLTGLSKNISSLLTGVIVLVWLLAPLIGQAVTGGSSGSDRALISQFSPIQAFIVSAEHAHVSGQAAIAVGTQATDLDATSRRLFTRWLTYAVTTGVLGLGLALWNIMAYRKILAKFKSMSQQPQTPQVQQPQQIPAEVIGNMAAPDAMPVPADAPPTEAATPDNDPQPS